MTDMQKTDNSKTKISAERLETWIGGAILAAALSLVFYSAWRTRQDEKLKEAERKVLSAEPVLPKKEPSIHAPLTPIEQEIARLENKIEKLQAKVEQLKKVAHQQAQQPVRQSEGREHD